MSYPDMYYIKKENESLSQGDIFLKFESKIFPQSEQGELGFITLTYTCDLEHPEDLNYILFCPIFDFDILIEKYIEKLSNKTLIKIQEALENIINNLFNNDKRYYFFLSPIPEVSRNPAYAHLEQITKIPNENIGKLIENRKASLKEPWREKLGWMTGNLFNRIAIADINKTVSTQFIQSSGTLKSFIEVRSNQIKNSLTEYFDKSDEITQIFEDILLPIFLKNEKTTRDIIEEKLRETYDETKIRRIFEAISNELNSTDNEFLRDMITFEKKHHKLENFRINIFFKSLIQEVLSSNKK